MIRLNIVHTSSHRRRVIAMRDVHLLAQVKRGNSFRFTIRYNLAFQIYHRTLETRNGPGCTSVSSCKRLMAAEVVALFLTPSPHKGCDLISLTAQGLASLVIRRLHFHFGSSPPNVF
ncbi:unnamed protein product [Nesidiocoris tenuis]|uniref:Uncharacterized protein n=1 Tax=Nesidiocoris tenuis TaxID=355587 RepID=A0A6H5GIS5_9HEMI|nr:unnamed protein product [Nesidiocoris tenuis]